MEGEQVVANIRYKNPDLIFCDNCPENFRVQKLYFLKGHLTSPDQYKCQQYKCQQCGVSHWPAGNEGAIGEVQEKKLLSLELHHKDSNQKNSLISNLALLCPNCHRAQLP
jgi:protein-arginine kinase activator protein McsA